MSYKEELGKKLLELQDLKYRDFLSSLLPGIPKETIIGIRTPVLRKFAREFEKTEEAKDFIGKLPHYYYEENNLHMMVISNIKDYEKCMEEIQKFIPYINNWATCDLPRPKCFAAHRGELLPEVKKWIESDKAYVTRYGIGTLMNLYLDEDFREEYLEWVSAVESEEYYVNMMTAWYFATALAKKWDETILYIQEKKLSDWVHKKTIQKAIESYRISSEQKEYLRSLR